MPIDVEEIVARFDELENEFRIVCEKPEMDILRLRVEYKDDVKALKDLKEKIEEALFDELGLSSEVDLAPRGSLERVTFKAQRVERLYS